jgi:hypothetical protein
MATERVVRVGGPEPSLSVMARRGKQVWLVVGAAVFVAIGTWMIVMGDLLLIVLGVVCVAVFALFGVLQGRQMLQSGPALVVDRSGITDRSSATPGGFVPWTEITGFGIWQSNGQKIVTVGVADPEAVLARANPIARIAMRASMRMSGTPFNIATTALPFTAEQLIMELMAFVPAPPAPPEDATPRH